MPLQLGDYGYLWGNPAPDQRLFLFDLEDLTGLNLQAMSIIFVVWICLFCLLSNFLKHILYAAISTVLTYWLFFGIRGFNPLDLIG